MPEKPYYKLTNEQFNFWLKNYGTVLKADAAYEMSDEADEILADQVEFQALLTELAALREQVDAKVTQIRNKRDDIEDEVGDQSGTLKSKKTLPTEKIEMLGLIPDAEADSSPAPARPLDLVVTGFSYGTNRIKFKRNGNKPSTIFITEARIGDATDFVQVNSDTTVTFNHTNQKPGVPVTYRVKARRAGMESEYSEEVTIYGE